jgi:basic amino acid/polyamine antiporter, APA family
MGVGGGASLVVASMIGAGIFGTSGHLAGMLGSAEDLLLAWGIGGFLALCAALCFGELGAAMPEAGAEYRYVRRLFGARAGFLCGFCSFVAGFCAPIAGVGLILGAYLEALGLPGTARTGAAVVIVGAAGLQLLGLRWSAGLNATLALLKLLLVAGFVLAAFLVPAAAAEPVTRGSATPGLFSGAFASALVFVAFAYTGWNAAAYLAGEMKAPERSLPRSLILGTSLVTLLYLGVNLAFLRAASIEEMAGVTEIGHLAATRLFGDAAGRWFSSGVAALLASTVLAFSIAGPRIPLAMAEEGQMPKRFARRDGRGVPRAAVALQTLIALAMLMGEPDEILIYVGMTLSIFAGLAVAGLFVLRRRGESGGFRCPLHPLPALAFLGLSAGMVVFSATNEPVSAVATLLTLTVALGFERALQAR